VEDKIEKEKLVESELKDKLFSWKEINIILFILLPYKN